MREYSLQDPEYRKTIDLTNYRTLIENTIHSVSPTINVEVYKDHYTIDPDPPKGDLIKIGRLLAQMNNLGQYCIIRSLLFKGEKVRSHDELKEKLSKKQTDKETQNRKDDSDE